MYSLGETKSCTHCGEKESRLAAKFCCWCGKPFEVVIIEFKYGTRYTFREDYEKDLASAKAFISKLAVNDAITERLLNVPAKSAKE